MNWITPKGAQFEDYGLNGLNKQLNSSLHVPLYVGHKQPPSDIIKVLNREAREGAQFRSHGMQHNSSIPAFDGWKRPPLSVLNRTAPEDAYFRGHGRSMSLSTSLRIPPFGERKQFFPNVNIENRMITIGIQFESHGLNKRLNRGLNSLLHIRPYAGLKRLSSDVNNHLNRTVPAGTQFQGHGRSKLFSSSLHIAEQKRKTPTGA